MIPEKLTLTGFLSYQQKVEIDFSSFEVACISGLNGSGKSSLLDAITWSLFGQARTRDDDIINLQSETAEVTYIFSYEGNLYKVQRAKTAGKTTLLEFHIQGSNGEWKALTERTLRATEALISDILKMEYETFVNASFFLQGKADQFTQQRPADRKRILGSILGLEIWESYRKETFNQRRSVETEITALEGRLQEINTELAEENQRRARLKEIEANMQAVSSALHAQTSLLDELRKKATRLEENRKRANALSTQAEQTQSELDTLKQRLSDRQEEKQTFSDLMSRQDQIETSYQAWQKTLAELAVWDKTANSFNQQKMSRHAPLTEIETAKTRLETELENLKAQAARINEHKVELESLKASITEIQRESEQHEKALKEKAALDTQFQKILQKQTEARAENPLLKSEMDTLKGRIDQLKSAEGAECPLCGQPLSPADRTRLITELETEGKQKGDQYRANLTLLESVEAQIKEISAKLAKYEGTEEQLRQSNRKLDQNRHQIETIEQEIKTWEEQGLPRREEITSLMKSENFALEARKRLAEIDEQLKETGYDAAEHDRIRRLEHEQRSAGDEQRQLENARATLQPLEREINDLSVQIERVEETLKNQINEAQEAAAQISPDDEAIDLISAEQEMMALKQQENQVRMELGAAQQKVDVLERQKKRQTELEAEKDALAIQVKNFKILERAFGKNGVPAMLIEQALPQIESKANEILNKLSGGTTTIQFLTQQAYKSEKRTDLRETLEILITDSQGPRGYDLFSGGEGFRINFAIRLALSEVLAQRAGARLQTLVIDEGFGSQDQLSRQRLVEAINIVKADFKKILVITHIESLKEAFPTRLEVTKTSAGSQIELVQ
ncbi:MAG: SMC family ATPase [Anaerolineales bacterium]|nr:SMC family ATPase [Anaerolineales bacterium]